VLLRREPIECWQEFSKMQGRSCYCKARKWKSVSADVVVWQSLIRLCARTPIGLWREVMVPKWCEWAFPADDQRSPHPQGCYPMPANCRIT
jgi:hypothetical protein